MPFIRPIALTVSLLFSTLSGAVTLEVEEPSVQSEPELMSKMPKVVDSFTLQGYKYFNDGSGYSIRYSNPRKQRMADLYIYEVAEENASLKHSDLVVGSTRATMQAISSAAKQGHYDNYNVIHAAIERVLNGMNSPTPYFLPSLMSLIRMSRRAKNWLLKTALKSCLKNSSESQVAG